MPAGKLGRLGTVALVGAAVALPATASARGGYGPTTCTNSNQSTALSFSMSPGRANRVGVASDGGTVGLSLRAKGQPPFAFGCGGHGSPVESVGGHLGDRDDVFDTSGRGFNNVQGNFEAGPLSKKVTLNIGGGNGDDRIHGHPGDGVLNGGRDNDVIIDTGGADVLRGGSGNDRILARDGDRDLIRCGGGNDVVKADPEDVLFSC